ncbi:MAG: ROK family glucokinase [Eubacterium sp.]|nr:ROK family glucokinase [Eubacterium sp.]
MSRFVIGADVGGTTVKIGVFTTEGSLVEKWEIPTDISNSGEAVLPDIAASCESYIMRNGLAKSDFGGIGMGLPGPVDSDGHVEKCVNIGWGKKDVAGEMEALLGIPAFAGNDANVAALGEMWQGSGKGMKNIVMVTLGTGVGGGVIVNEKIVSGFHGYGGEIGHMKVNIHEKERCGCGGCGCLEQYCSATGIVNETLKALSRTSEETSLRSISPLSCRDIFNEAKSGDEFALRQVEIFADRLARGLSLISCVTDPEEFIIGGGVSRAGQIIPDLVAKNFGKYVFGGQKKTRFTLAVLGNDAGIYGAARLVMK